MTVPNACVYGHLQSPPYAENWTSAAEKIWGKIASHTKKAELGRVK